MISNLLASTQYLPRGICLPEFVDGAKAAPTFAGRDEWEQEIARALGKLGQEQLAYLLDKMGDPPDFNKLTTEDWETISGGSLRILRPALEQIFLEAAQRVLDSQPIGVDWALVNERAADWASRYGYSLVGDMTQNTRAAMQKKIPAFYREAMTMGDLKKSLPPLFGVVRADSIATTEITRASFLGERAVIGEIEKQGIQMRGQWKTSNDEIVRRCLICWPLHNTYTDDQRRFYNPKLGRYYAGPPGHPRCRCACGWSPVDL